MFLATAAVEAQHLTNHLDTNNNHLDTNENHLDTNNFSFGYERHRAKAKVIWIRTTFQKARLMLSQKIIEHTYKEKPKGD